MESVGVPGNQWVSRKSRRETEPRTPSNGTDPSENMNPIDEIKARVDIVDVISKHVELKRSGRNFKALCPFHTEKTPSFVVFPDTQTWRCFGACAEGGDIYSFLMKKQGWDFADALRALAEQTGVELIPQTPQQIKRQEASAQLYELLNSATLYYMHLLRSAPEAEAARDYVVERGLLPHTVEQFQVGYALNQWNGARDFLRSKEYTDDDMLAVGLLVEKQDTGRRYDRFRGRLVIPIRDLRGRVVGFGARTLPTKPRSAVEKPDAAPKYINSPQTELFDKSTILYGLDMAKKGIREVGQAIIVEGYMDVMQAQQSGCANVIAQMGTALTAPQLRQLKRYTNRLILALDADAAGRKATLRGLDIARQTLDRKAEVIFDPRGLVRQESRLQADIRVAILPPGLDPDNLIRSDAAAWIQLIETASPLVEYIINAIATEVDPNDAKEKSAAVARAMPVIQDVSNAVERDHYTQYLARRLGVDERTLVTMAARPAPLGRGRVRPRLQSATASSRGTPRPPAGDANESTPSPSVTETQPHARPPSLHSPKELYCLNQIMTAPHIWRQVNRTLLEHKLRPICAQDFADPQNHAIFVAVQKLDPPDYSDEADTIHQLQESLDEALYARLHAIQAQHTPNPNIPSEGIVSDPVPPEKVTRYLASTVLKMRVEEIERAKSESNRALAEALSQDDSAATGTYTQQVLELERRRLKIDQALSLISYLLPSDRERQR